MKQLHDLLAPVLALGLAASQGFAQTQPNTPQSGSPGATGQQQVPAPDRTNSKRGESNRPPVRTTPDAKPSQFPNTPQPGQPNSPATPAGPVPPSAPNTPGGTPAPGSVPEVPHPQPE